MLKSDVFFFITSVAIVILTIAILVAFFYLIKILRDFKEVSKKVKDESELIIGDVEEARKNIKQKGKTINSFINAVASKVPKPETKKRKRKSK